MPDQPAHAPTSPPALAYDAKGIAGPIFPISIRQVRALDAAALMPKAFRVAGSSRKWWRRRDLELWCEWGFCDRSSFEERLARLNGDGRSELQGDKRSAQR